MARVFNNTFVGCAVLETWASNGLTLVNNLIASSGGDPVGTSGRIASAHHDLWFGSSGAPTGTPRPSRLIDHGAPDMSAQIAADTER